VAEKVSNIKQFFFHLLKMQPAPTRPYIFPCVLWSTTPQCDTFNYRLTKSNEMQQYADIYLLLNYSTCFGRPACPSSGVHKTVVAASGTDHTIWGASFLKRDQISPYLVTFEEVCSPDSMIYTIDCNYSFMYSWWRARCQPETCRVI